MLHETIRLREIFPSLPGGYDATLVSYCPDNSPEIDSRRVRTTILICPGGGYTMTSDREAEPVALRFTALGYNAFVLRYAVKPARYPEALLELSASVAYIRRNAERFHVHPGRIAVCGFSAGGHLAGCLGAFWQEPFLSRPLGIRGEENRPNALVLCYPVISSGSFAHEGSFEALLGEDKDGLRPQLSLENRVNPDVPPVFLWHTFSDGSVPVENSLLFAQALRRYGVPFELHIYPQGHHGLSLATEQSGSEPDKLEPHCSTWVPLCDEWLRIVLKS